MKKILLTGCSGFVGSQVLQNLNNENVSIRVVLRDDKINLLNKYQNVYEVIKTEDFFSESNDWYDNTCKGIDTIIHLAWYTEHGKYLKSPLNFDCLSGTLNFAKSSVKQGIKKFVGIGTCFEYDLVTNKKLDIDAPLKPLTPYAEAKVLAFKELTTLFKSENIQFIWARLFYLYGEGEDYRRLIPVLNEKLKRGERVQLTEGTEIRDYINVTEVGNIISRLAMSPREGPFNVCSGVGVSIRDLAEKIAINFNGLHLLDFGAYNINTREPSYVVGQRYEV